MQMLWEILLLILLRISSTPLFIPPFFPNRKNAFHLTCLLNLETPCCIRKGDAMKDTAVSFQHLMVLKQIPDIHCGTPNRWAQPSWNWSCHRENLAYSNMEIENWWASNIIIAGSMKRASPDPENPKAHAAERFIQANLHLLLCG